MVGTNAFFKEKFVSDNTSYSKILFINGFLKDLDADIIHSLIILWSV